MKLNATAIFVKDITSAKIYFQDESRFGLKAQTSKVVTMTGINPIVAYQEEFKSTYLHGFFSLMKICVFGK